MSIVAIPKNNKKNTAPMSGVPFYSPIFARSTNAHISANGVVIGVVVSALVIVRNEIRLFGIGLHIGKDIVDLILGWLNATKIVEGRSYVLGGIHCAYASVGGKNGLDNRRIRCGVKVTRENVWKR